MTNVASRGKLWSEDASASFYMALNDRSIRAGFHMAYKDGSGTSNALRAWVGLVSFLQVHTGACMATLTWQHSYLWCPLCLAYHHNWVMLPARQVPQRAMTLRCRSRGRYAATWLGCSLQVGTALAVILITYFKLSHISSFKVNGQDRTYTSSG